MADFEDSIYPELRRVRERYPIWPGQMQRGWIIFENRLAEQDEKKNFAEALSNEIAKKIADGLRHDFPNILPDEFGQGLESRARSAKGYKQLDVNYSTPQLGLGLGISVKTLNFRDKPAANRALKLSRYTKNFSRIDNELRAEAQDYHVRQPYAVLAAFIFLPMDAADDGSNQGASSFGQAVQGIFRFRAGRTSPSGMSERFERVFIALYDPGDAERASEYGNVRCFDVTDPPPKVGRPDVSATCSLTAALRRVVGDYDARNENVATWSDAAVPEGEKLELFEQAQRLATEMPDDENG